jgi:homoserine dehydrogenase
MKLDLFMNEPFKIGVAGLGTVGTGLLQLMETNGARMGEQLGKPVRIVAVSARTRSKDRRLQLADKRWVDDPIKLAQDPGIDCFVELIGGEDGIARKAVEAALSAKKHVAAGKTRR